MTSGTARTRPWATAAGCAVLALALASCAPSEQDTKAEATRRMESGVAEVTRQVQELLRSPQGPAVLADPGLVATSLDVAATARVLVTDARADAGALTVEVSVTGHVDSGGGLSAQTAEATRCVRLQGAPGAGASVTSATIPCGPAR